MRERGEAVLTNPTKCEKAVTEKHLDTLFGGVKELEHTNHHHFHYALLHHTRRFPHVIASHEALPARNRITRGTSRT
ncbi:hypothetical protein E2C01_018045 [Portunus trituberculatus]|uniref:Uncharacterized protein n=1 Tax=Portunus trituberculatus TaxID=210409 RepID=A0A5B7DTI3_PORTR|nr:hypothetical protein [Portunus trituberculatus]